MTNVLTQSTKEQDAAHNERLDHYYRLVTKFNTEFGFKEADWPYPFCITGERLAREIREFESEYR